MPHSSMSTEDDFPKASEYTHLIIFDKPVPEGGGIQNMAYWLAQSLKNQGLRVVIAGQKKYLRHPAYQGSGIEFIETEKPFRTKHTSDIRLIALALRIKRKLPGKVIAYSLIINNIRILRWLQPLLGWKLISFLHGNETLRLLRRRPRTLTANLESCTCVFANSRYTVSLAQRLGDFPNIKTIPPGVPDCFLSSEKSNAFRKQHEWENRQIILTLSRLVERKGHQTVIEAVDKLRDKHPDILLLIAGTGNYKIKLEKQVADLGLQSHVTFLGLVPEKEKIALYDCCDIYCMPSRIDEEKYDVEGFGITFIEAASRGKVAIGSTSGGIPDAIEDGKSGLLINPGDLATLVNHIDDILSNPDKYDDMRQYAKQRAKESYAWPTITPKILAEIENALP